MKTQNIFLALCFFAITCGLSACRKFVEVPAPDSSLVTETVFDNNATATAAQTVIYSKMSNNNESATMASFTGLLSDELTNYSTSLNQVAFYINSMNPTRNGNVGPWGNAYNYIYQANAVAEGLQKNTGVGAAVSKQLTGESLFVRAFWYFYLTNLYGDVPLVTTTNYTVNATLPRSPKNLVYQQMVSDLKSAQNLLNNNYVDGTDTVITIDRVRPTKSAAAALLARVYLYFGDLTKDQSNYVNAETMSTSVINNTSLYKLDALDGVFLANSPEAIWQLGIPSPTPCNCTLDGQTFILESAPTSVSMSTELYNTFEPGDQRKVKWVGTYVTTSPAQTFNFPYKYKIDPQSNAASVTEYVMVLRLAEQYLIRSEARAQLGNISGALADLNTIRNRAGLPDYAGPADKASVLAAILHERQVELFTEWGNRWLDLIRTGNVKAVMSVVTPLKGGTWNPDNHQALYPIPQGDIQSDKKLTQNPGY